MEYATSQIQLRGTLVNEPEFSHENHGKTFYRFLLEVPRLSGTSDILPVIAESGHLLQLKTPGTILYIAGQIRSHNIRSDGKRHLLVFVFAMNILCESGDSINDCVVEGFLCREPIYRKTPMGREICYIMLAVPRSYHRADYLPCILGGKTARQISQCHIRDKIQIIGRLQSRNYTKQTNAGAEIRTAYEVSALSAQVILDTE